MRLRDENQLTQPRLAKRVLSLQAILTLAVTVAAAAFGFVPAISVLIGGSACLVANAAVALWVFRDYRAPEPGQLLSRLYRCGGSQDPAVDWVFRRRLPDDRWAQPAGFARRLFLGAGPSPDHCSPNRVERPPRPWAQSGAPDLVRGNRRLTRPLAETRLMSSSETLTSQAYIQHHLTNLTFGHLPEHGWGFAHNGAGGGADGLSGPSTSIRCSSRSCSGALFVWFFKKVADSVTAGRPGHGAELRRNGSWSSSTRTSAAPSPARTPWSPPWR